MTTKWFKIALNCPRYSNFGSRFTVCQTAPFVTLCSEPILGAILAHLGAVLGHLGAVLGRLEAVLGPSWGCIGAVLEGLRLSWAKKW